MSHENVAVGCGHSAVGCGYSGSHSCSLDLEVVCLIKMNAFFRRMLSTCRLFEAISQAFNPSLWDVDVEEGAI